MDQTIDCDVLVIGAGPGGYAAAIRCGQLGLSVVVADSGVPGGTCLTVGCIPSKALIHAADAFAEVVRGARDDHPLGIRVEHPTIDLGATVAWKDEIVHRLTGGVESLLARAGVTTLQGWATVTDGKSALVATSDGEVSVTTRNLVLACGSTPVELSVLPFGGRVISSTEALDLTDLPHELVVVGGGYIGLELGTAFAKLGSTVTVVEVAERVLPTFDPALTRPVEHRLRALGVTVLTGAQALGADDAGLRIVKDGHESTIPADRILVTVGRRPRTSGWGLDELDLDRHGPFVAVDRRCRTSMTGVYAIGDLTGEPMLAHRAIAQGELVAEVIAGRRRRWDKVAVPAVVFTDPEIVSVGLDPVSASDAGISVVEGTFPFAASGRALSAGDSDGFVRVVARSDDHLLLGVQAVGRGVSELAAPFGLALEMGATLEDIAATIHAHPTRGEGFQEAALHGLGRPLHR